VSDHGVHKLFLRAISDKSPVEVNLACAGIAVTIAAKHLWRRRPEGSIGVVGGWR